MTQRQIKSGFFALTALNTIASSYYFNYLFFFLRDHFGFGDRDNLRVSALFGFLYIFSAWQCGRFAQRHGFITSLKIGFGGLTAMMVIGGCTSSLPATLVVLVGYSIALLFTWPALEALVSENETRSGVQHMVGIYNCTWSGAAAVAYFTGGPLYDRLGRGAVFWLPAIIFFGQFVCLHWLARVAHGAAGSAQTPLEDPQPHPEATSLRQPVSPAGFLKMAWLANPFAYVAMYTLLAVMPGIAHKLSLSPTRVGLFCSVWLFARLGAFAGLWHWAGWHYRFRWLLLAFVTLIASFLFLLLAHQLWVFVLAQIFFGLAAGLIYYSSLFYSMDVGDASAEHGGFHEAAIGAGIFAGPAVGAASLQFLPHDSSAGAYAVTGFLLLGLTGLLFLWQTQRQLWVWELGSFGGASSASPFSMAIFRISPILELPNCQTSKLLNS